MMYDQRQGVVSIHAPAGGCDFTIYDTGLFDEVSIHAPAGGCDISR